MRPSFLKQPRKVNIDSFSKTTLFIHKGKNVERDTSIKKKTYCAKNQSFSYAKKTKLNSQRRKKLFTRVQFSGYPINNIVYFQWRRQNEINGGGQVEVLRNLLGGERLFWQHLSHFHPDSKFYCT